MDDLDRRLLTLIQKGIPLKPRPFEILAHRTGTDHAEVLLRLYRFKKNGLIQSIRTVFDNQKLGYQSVLAALQVTDAEREEAIRLICAEPLVTHLSLHRHDLNLWFIQHASLGKSLQRGLVDLKQKTNASRALQFPLLRIYKNQIADEEMIEFGGCAETEINSLTEDEAACIWALQQDFPLTDDPFQKWADQLGWTETKFVSLMQSLSERGILKRISAEANLKPLTDNPARMMVVWQVPGEKADAIGEQVAAWQDVRHCCRRIANVGFPYSIFALIHTSQISECARIIKEIQIQIGPWPHLILVREKELKKSKLRLRPTSEITERREVSEPPAVSDQEASFKLSS